MVIEAAHASGEVPAELDELVQPTSASSCALEGLTVDAARAVGGGEASSPASHRRRH